MSLCPAACVPGVADHLCRATRTQTALQFAAAQRLSRTGTSPELRPPRTHAYGLTAAGSISAGWDLDALLPHFERCPALAGGLVRWHSSSCCHVLRVAVPELRCVLFFIPFARAAAAVFAPADCKRAACAEQVQGSTGPSACMADRRECVVDLVCRVQGWLALVCEQL